jgi:hypothetical protein
MPDLTFEERDELIRRITQFLYPVDVTFGTPSFINGEIKMKRTLDFKTIKKLKFKWVVVERMTSFQWIEYNNLRKNKIPRLDNGDQERKLLRFYRQRIKSNLRMKVDLNSEIGTYITFKQDFTPVEYEQKGSIYEYILKRIREKIHNNRLEKSVMTKDIATPKQIEYRLPPTIGLVRLSSSTFTNVSQYDYIDMCFEAKVPKTDDKYIGLELEMFTPLNHNELAERLVKFNKNINIKDDCSIELDKDLYDVYCDCGEDSCNEEHNESEWKPVELNILMTEKEYKDGLLLDICNILKEIGARVNESCGLHVHLDMRSRNVKTSFHNLTLCQDILFSLVESHRARNTYCRKTKTNNMDLEDEAHYNAINGQDAYNKFQTIEIRIHHGSVEYKAISSWVSFLVNIADYEQLLHYDLANKPKILATVVNVDDNIKSYYKLQQVGV